MLVLYATIIDIMTGDVYEGGGIGGIDGGWRRPPELFKRSKRTFFFIFSRGGLFRDANIPPIPPQTGMVTFVEEPPKFMVSLML